LGKRARLHLPPKRCTQRAVNRRLKSTRSEPIQSLCHRGSKAWPGRCLRAAPRPMSTRSLKPRRSRYR